MLVQRLLAIVALGLVAGCGSGSMPVQASTDARAKVSAAEAVGAENQPQAALHLKMARDQIRQADAMIRDGENDEARLVLQRAKVDAELALALSQEAQMRARAQQAWRQVSELERQAR